MESTISTELFVEDSILGDYLINLLDAITLVLLKYGLGVSQNSEIVREYFSPSEVVINTTHDEICAELTPYHLSTTRVKLSIAKAFLDVHETDTLNEAIMRDLLQNPRKRQVFLDKLRELVDIYYPTLGSYRVKVIELGFDYPDRIRRYRKGDLCDGESSDEVSDSGESSDGVSDSGSVGSTTGPKDSHDKNIVITKLTQYRNKPGHHDYP